MSELDLPQPGVQYHYGAFPPKELDYSVLASPLADAAAAIARYAQMLGGIQNTRLFLTPLERREALSSSRMEGTISTLDELLMYEASLEELEEEGAANSARRDTHEVYAYRRAMNKAESMIDKGAQLSPDLLCVCHKSLLTWTRGREKAPGKFKTDQNYLVDMATRQILFTPISPDQLQEGMDELFSFIDDSTEHPLIMWNSNLCTPSKTEMAESVAF